MDDLTFLQVIAGKRGERGALDQAKFCYIVVKTKLARKGRENSFQLHIKRNFPAVKF